jgi:hypothetical protein
MQSLLIDCKTIRIKFLIFREDGSNNAVTMKEIKFHEQEDEKQRVEAQEAISSYLAKGNIENNIVYPKTRDGIKKRIADTFALAKSNGQSCVFVLIAHGDKLGRIWLQGDEDWHEDGENEEGETLFSRGKSVKLSGADFFNIFAECRNEISGFTRLFAAQCGARTFAESFNAKLNQTKGIHFVEVVPLNRFGEHDIRRALIFEEDPVTNEKIVEKKKKKPKKKDSGINQELELGLRVLTSFLGITVAMKLKDWPPSVLASLPMRVIGGESVLFSEKVANGALFQRVGHPMDYLLLIRDDNSLEALLPLSVYRQMKALNILSEDTSAEDNSSDDTQ